jgi:hypothetical protein
MASKPGDDEVGRGDEPARDWECEQRKAELMITDRTDKPELPNW